MSRRKKSKSKFISEWAKKNQRTADIQKIKVVRKRSKKQAKKTNRRCSDCFFCLLPKRRQFQAVSLMKAYIIDCRVKHLELRLLLEKLYILQQNFNFAEDTKTIENLSVQIRNLENQINSLLQKIRTEKKDKKFALSQGRKGFSMYEYS